MYLLMNSRLFLQSENQWVTILALTSPGPYVVGRGEESDVTVPDANCSRRHFELYLQDDSWWIRDLSSKNGTLVGGKILSADAVLQPGTAIRIGESNLVFDVNEPVDEGSVTRGSVSLWIADLKQGSDEDRAFAQNQLVATYYERLCALAKRKSRKIGHRVEDEEDAALCALGSFFGRIESLPKLDDRNDLWKILATFTARQVHRQQRRAMAKKRGLQQTVTESVLDAPLDGEGAGLDNLGDNELDHTLAVQMEETWNRYLDALDDPELREVAMLKLEGYSNEEIGEELNCSSRTIRRRVNAIRICWEGIRDGEGFGRSGD